MTKKTGFMFEWSVDEWFTLAEIWPDGDAPENPTVEDVMAVIKKHGDTSAVLRDWNVYPVLLVDGKEVES